MKRMTSIVSTFVLAALFSTAAVFAQTPASTPDAPVPPAILNGKNIFVSNAGADSGLFPRIFSGDPDRGYNQFYAALKATGKYTLVSDSRQADLVLELRLIVPNGLSELTIRLVIYEANSHYILWTMSKPIEMSILKKTRDKNFDNALAAIVEDFVTLSGKAPAATH